MRGAPAPFRFDPFVGLRQEHQVGVARRRGQDALVVGEFAQSLLQLWPGRESPMRDERLACAGYGELRPQPEVVLEPVGRRPMDDDRRAPGEQGQGGHQSRRKSECVRHQTSLGNN